MSDLNLVGISGSLTATKLIEDRLNELYAEKASQSATIVVAASNAKDPSKSDFQCDGSNDRSVILSAIDALPESGGNILFSEGLFTFDDIPVKKNIWICGSGLLGTTFKLPSGSAKNMFVYRVNDGAEQVALRFSNFFADGNRQNGATGGLFKSKELSGEIKDVVFDCVVAFYFGSTNVIDIINCWGYRFLMFIAEFNAGTAINVNPGTVAGSAQSLYMMFCKIRNNGGNGIILNGVKNCHLIGNEFDSGEGSDATKWCLKLVGSDENNISGNLFQAWGTRLGSGLYVDATSDRNNISGNQFHGGGVATTGIQVVSGASQNKIIGNTIINFATNQLLDAGTDTVKIGNAGDVAAVTDSVFPGKVTAGMMRNVGDTFTSSQYDKTDVDLASITGLGASNLLAGKTYRFEATLFITADATGGTKVAMYGGCTATSIIYTIELLDKTTKTNTVVDTKTALADAVSDVGVTSGTYKISGTITVNAAGWFTPKFAQSAANGTSSVLAGSYMKIWALD